MSGEETVFKLSAPIRAHNEDLVELRLRKPTGKDVMELGFPYLIMPGDSDKPGVQIQPKVAGKYVVRLAGIPMSSVEQLAPTDIRRLWEVVMGFFPDLEDEDSAQQAGSKSETPETS